MKVLLQKKVLLTVLFVALADQLSKYVIRTEFEQGEILPIFPKFFNLTFIYNPGAAFGLFGDLPETYRQIVIGLVSLIAFLVIIRLVLFEAKNDIYSLIALSAILGGAVGNVIDRVSLGAVVDFLDVYWNDYHWPAFNIADSAISLGVVVVFFRMLLSGSAEKHPGEANAGAKLNQEVSTNV